MPRRPEVAGIFARRERWEQVCVEGSWNTLSTDKQTCLSSEYCESMRSRRSRRRTRPCFRNPSSNRVWARLNTSRGRVCAAFTGAMPVWTLVYDFSAKKYNRRVYAERVRGGEEWVTGSEGVESCTGCRKSDGRCLKDTSLDEEITVDLTFVFNRVVSLVKVCGFLKITATRAVYKCAYR